MNKIEKIYTNAQPLQVVRKLNKMLQQQSETFLTDLSTGNSEKYLNYNNSAVQEDHVEAWEQIHLAKTSGFRTDWSALKNYVSLI